MCMTSVLLPNIHLRRISLIVAKGRLEVVHVNICLPELRCNDDGCSFGNLTKSGKGFVKRYISYHVHLEPSGWHILVVQV